VGEHNGGAVVSMSANHRLTGNERHFATKPDPWAEYERRKRVLQRKNLSSRAYELEIQRIAKELGI
jgi:hypothetical protein